jgi:hypothetical protein
MMFRKIGIWQTKDAAEATTYGQRPGMIRVQDVDNNKVINGADRQVLGKLPVQTGLAEMTNRVAYKNFDLSIVTFARIGQTVAVTYLASDGGANGIHFSIIAG